MSKFKSMADVRAANKNSGYNFFSRQAMRFFGSKVCSALYAGRYFITSERISFSNPHTRGYTIRYVCDDGDIKNLCDYGTIRSIEAARERVRELIKKVKQEEPK